MQSSLLTQLSLVGRLLEICGLGKFNFRNHSVTFGAQAAVMDECHLDGSCLRRQTLHHNNGTVSTEFNCTRNLNRYLKHDMMT